MNAKISYPKHHIILALTILFTCSTGIQSFAQEKNEIDEKRKTIANIKDTLVKPSNHVYAILAMVKPEI